MTYRSTAERAVGLVRPRAPPPGIVQRPPELGALAGKRINARCASGSGGLL